MKSIPFITKNPPPPANLGAPVSGFLQNAGAAAVCHPVAEGLLVAAYCAFLERTGGLLSKEKGLGGLMAQAYGDMAKSPAFWLTGSAVPFCMSTHPEGGHLFMHVPKGADSSTPVLLLLHGYGGNLLYFPWAVWKEVPECILIAPSWQVDWTEGKCRDRRTYVEKALAVAEEKIGTFLSKPWLVPLSQGGPMAFELAVAKPKSFKGLLGISTYHGDACIAKLPKKFPVRLCHGDTDERVSCEDAMKAIISIQQSGGDAEATVIKGADHFLLLSCRKKMGDFLRTEIS
jgi:predicted esterase